MACIRTGGDHAFQRLGQKDDETFAHRCGNCGELGTSDTAEGAVTLDSEGEEAAAGQSADNTPARSIAEKG